MNSRGYIRLLSFRLGSCQVHRTFATSSAVYGRKSKLFQTKEAKFIKMYKPPHPFDERFYISSKDVSRYKPHGSEWAEKYVERNCKYCCITDFFCKFLEDV